MYEIKTVAEKNRIYITFKGFLSVEDIKAAVNKEIEEVSKLKPGFDVIVDISDFKTSTQEGAEELARGQKLLIERGINRLIRVIGTQTLSRMQLDRKAKETGLIAEEAASVEEAERMLES